MVTTWARYLTPSAAHRRLGLVCLGTGAQHGALPMCGPRALSCFAAVLLTGGRGRIALGPGKLREVVAPALFWLRAGQSHRYGPDAAGWAENWVLFDGPAAQAYVDLGYIGDPVAPLPDPAAVRRSFARIAAACQSDTVNNDVAAAAAIHDLLVVANQGGPGDDPGRASCSPHCAGTLTSP